MAERGITVTLIDGLVLSYTEQYWEKNNTKTKQY